MLFNINKISLFVLFFLSLNAHALVNARETLTWTSPKTPTQILEILNDVTNWCQNCRYRMPNIRSQRIVQETNSSLVVWTDLDQIGNPSYFTKRSWAADSEGTISLRINLQNETQSENFSSRSHLENDPGRISRISHQYKITPVAAGSIVEAIFTTTVDTMGIVESRVRENLRTSLQIQQRYTSQ